MVPLQAMSSTGIMPFDTAAVGVYLQRTSITTKMAQASAVKILRQASSAYRWLQALEQPKCRSRLAVQNLLGAFCCCSGSLLI